MKKQKGNPYHPKVMSKLSYILILGFCLTGSMQAQLPAGMVAAYPFCGNALDMVGTNNGLVVGATLTTDRFGAPNNAYYFTGGPNCYINLGTSTTLKPTEGSISVWARPDGFSTQGGGYVFNPIMLTKNQPGNNCYEGYTIGLGLSGNNPKLSGVTTQPFCNQSICDYSTVAYQNWYHIVLTWNFDSTTLYVNGILRQADYRGFNSVYLSGDSVMVGNSANVQNNRFFLGAIDDIIYYDHVLSASEVASLYTTPWDCFTGITEETELSTLNVFPNPCSGILTLQVDNMKKKPAGALYNLLGELVTTFQVTKPQMEIDLEKIPSGIYFLRITDGNTSVIKKIIRE